MPSGSYEVRVRGPVPDEVLADLCADLQMRADVVFHGVVRDQSVVHGLLARLRELGIELVDVRREAVAPVRQPSSQDTAGPPS